MEKLKAKHDHKLTDILKVAIFGLMLILPGLILLPSMLYYGVNEHATAPTEQVEKIEYERVDFNQKIKNGNFSSNEEWYTSGNVTLNFSNNEVSMLVSSTNSYIYQNIDLNENHAYLFKVECNLTTLTTDVRLNIYNPNVSGYDATSVYTSGNELKQVLEVQKVSAYTSTYTLRLIDSRSSGFDTIVWRNCQCFDLTQMFGQGNEPTLQEFNTYYTKNYYEYTESRYEILEKPTGTYETYTDITSQIQFNWNSLWQQPLFSWTNYTILKQGLDNFTYVFGITQTSYINNLITYELIMVAIYIVIDIVLTLFKWLTHLIGEK